MYVALVFPIVFATCQVREDQQQARFVIVVAAGLNIYFFDVMTGGEKQVFFPSGQDRTEQFVCLCAREWSSVEWSGLWSGVDGGQQRVTCELDDDESAGLVGSTTTSVSFFTVLSPLNRAPTRLVVFLVRRHNLAEIFEPLMRIRPFIYSRTIIINNEIFVLDYISCLLYTSPSPRDRG